MLYNQIQPTTDNTLIVVAAKPESQGKLEAMTKNVIYTGVGKVNAAMVLATRLAGKRKGQDVILNIGTAGSHTHPIGSVIQCSGFIQFDMNLTAQGFDQFTTPFEKQSELISPILLGGLESDTLYTSDSFITDKSLKLPLMDMEGYALAKACQYHETPFISVKYVVDSGGKPPVSWAQSMKAASDRLSEFTQQFFQGLFPILLNRKQAKD